VAFYCWMIGLVLWSGSVLANAAFDHDHKAWTALLQKHVVLVEEGNATRVDYAGFKADQGALSAYLESLSRVPAATYQTWSRDQQLAFLINAYNAYTVDLILTRYPDLKSIRDLGSLFSSPWKRRFIDLLGESRSLDNIEHDMIREPGVFDEPRIHAAVNCASIGCPALRHEAFVAEHLNAQLQDSLERFLSDRSRNRYNPESKTLEVSKIFDWYGKDWDSSRSSYNGIRDLFAQHAERLAQQPSDQDLIRKQQPRVRFLDYDWALNDTATYSPSK
jgi:hypothetical protein